MNLKEFKKELLNVSKIRKEFESYDLAFEISQMLIEARVIKGVTQSKLAELIKTKQSGIARAENGTVLPKLSFLKKIADAFHTHLIVRFAFMDKIIMTISENSSTPQSTKMAYSSITQLPPVFIKYHYNSRRQNLGI